MRVGDHDHSSACPLALIRASRVHASALLSGTDAITGTTLTLDEEAQVFLPDSGQISAQRYKTSNYEAGVDNWPEVTEGGNRVLSTFDGTNPTGEWKLYVFDDTQQPDTGDRNGSGTFANGWALEFRGTR
jgi:hypothetical protein